jgi:hypothetical protein
MPQQQAAPTAPIRLPPTVAPPVMSVGNSPTRETLAPPPRPRASLTNLPKLTAAQAAPTNQDDNGATIISDGASPPAPAAPLPKLSAAHAAPAHQDDNGATMMAADRSNARTGPVGEPEEEEHITTPGGKLDRSMLERQGGSAGEQRSSRGTNARVPQSHGRQETDPGILTAEPPTNPGGNRVAPPTLRPANDGRAPPTQRAPGSETRARAQRTHTAEAAPMPPPPPRSSRQDDEAEDVAAIRRPSRSRGPLLGVMAALAVVAVAAGAFVALRPKAKGMIQVDVVPAEVHAKARLFINGEDLGSPGKFPAFRPAPAGSAVVMVVVDGYEPVTRKVEVKAGGAEMSKVRADFKANASGGQLLVETEPRDAEIRVDGQTVRRDGSSESYAADLPAGVTRTIEVSKAGFRTRTEKVTADGEPKSLKLRLEPAEVATPSPK